MLGLSLVLIGAVGLLAMTWLFPLTAIILPNRSSGTRSREIRPSRVVVLIPAHNEEEKLGRTLHSIQSSIREAQGKFPGVEFSICVGADGCSDLTAEVASASGANVVVFEKNQGKWNCIAELVKAAQGFDWVVLADCGIIWPEHFLSELLETAGDTSVMAVAPTYRTPGAGRIEKLVWGVERHFKGLESLAGGPVSIHGATIAYRREELKAALDLLGRERWLNDDVVLPLVLRALFPENQIRYLSELSVFDALAPVAQGEPREFGRRRRLVYGNIQWIRGLLPLLYKRNAVAGTLALRRAFRVLWAYWGVSLVLGTAALLGQDFALLALASVLLAMVVRPPRALGKLFDSARASLLAPYYFFQASKVGGVDWK